MSLSDSKYWDEIKQGNVKSLAVVFNDYYVPLCIYASHIMHNNEVAQEIVADVFVKLWERKNDIDIIKTLKSYLYRCVFNASQDYLRSAQTLKHQQLLQINEQTQEIVAEDDRDFIDLLSYEEVEKDVINAIKSLPPNCRRIFLLSRHNNLSYNEIAEKLNISVNTVKTQIGRALNILRKELKNYLVLLFMLIICSR